MSASEAVKKEFVSLLEMQESLINLTGDKKDILNFGTAYQEWYSRAYKIVESLAPERLSEFTSYYLIDPKRKKVNAYTYTIQDYIMARTPNVNMQGHPRWNASNVISIRNYNQFQILKSLFSRIDSVISDVTGHLFAELQDSELVAAKQLKKINNRASGALAGVVLERHLQRVAVNHKINIKKKSPTISDLNDPLKSKGVYETFMWRKIQLLADIRNICSHQKSSEPTDEQVDELINGVNSVIKSVF